ncbi:hypothetical protein EYB25_000029 [Talaromyces marneffei]|nr:hypothetical protein EYB25_000029 [Talaromyces marneffei]
MLLIPSFCPGISSISPISIHLIDTHKYFQSQRLLNSPNLAKWLLNSTPLRPSRLRLVLPTSIEDKSNHYLYAQTGRT